MLIYDELVARGLIAQVTDEEEIKNLIKEADQKMYEEKKKTRIYLSGNDLKKIKKNGKNIRSNYYSLSL